MAVSRGFRAVLAALLLAALWTSQAFGHSSLEMNAPIGFDEKLGSYAALDSAFTGEDGKPLRLKELSGRSMLLVLGYYRCKNECNSLYTGLSKALRDIEGRPGRDWQVVSVSINPVETPRDAISKKSIAIASIEKPFPPEAWRFLVGTDENIDKLASSVGFSYRAEGEDFDHPLGIVMLAPDGKIVRYIVGPEFLPVDLNMSIMETSAGVVKPTIAKMLRFCMSYDPNKKQFGFNFLRVMGIITTVIVAALATVLVVAGRRKKMALISPGTPSGGRPGGRDPEGPTSHS
ncbi:MAG: SCO family protein [Spirochaetota bacterium]